MQLFDVRFRPLQVMAIGMLAFGAVACGSSDDVQTSDTAKALDLSNAGTVAGVITFEGQAPEPEMFDVSSDAHCLTHLDDGRHAVQTVKVSDGNLADVFVYVSQGLEGSYAPIGEPPVLNQKGCTYEPHVLGVVVGQPLTVRNSDETLHNVHIRAESNQEMNFGQPKQGMTREVVFAEPETPILIKCDVHGWMKSYVFALPHPGFDVSGTDGRYSFELPPGNYTLTAWHETLGTKTATVTVAAAQQVDASFAFGSGTTAAR